MAMTETREPSPPESPFRGREPAAPGRGVGLFIRFGAALLALGLVVFGVLYWQDQHVSGGPSLIDRQVAVQEAAVQKAPNNISARIALGTVYQQAGRADDAITQFDQVLKVAPGNLDALGGKGFALLAKGDLAGSTAAYQKIVTAMRSGEFAGSDTRLQAAYYYLGLIANRQHQPALALQQLQHALRIQPTDSDSMYQVGLALLGQNKPKDAIAVLQRALSFVPTGWCEPYQSIQSAYTSLKQPEEAAYATAMFTYCKGDTVQGKAQLEKLTSGPAAVDALLGLGIVAQTENDNAGAVAWYQKVLVKDPKNTVARSYLAALKVAPSGTPSVTK